MKISEDNRLIWIGIALTVTAPALTLFNNAILSVIGAACSLGALGCFIADHRKQKKAGTPAPHWLWLLFYPVYLWKRCTARGGDRKPFWIFMAAWGLALMLSTGNLTNMNHTLMAESAKPVVTEIVQRYNGGIECVKVNVTETVTPDFYRGTAILSNGAEIAVAIKSQGNGQILVNVLDK